MEEDQPLIMPELVEIKPKPLEEPEFRGSEIYDLIPQFRELRFRQPVFRDERNRMPPLEALGGFQPGCPVQGAIQLLIDKPEDFHPIFHIFESGRPNPSGPLFWTSFEREAG